jgi:regulatory protein
LYKKGIKSDIFDKAWDILSEDGIEVDEEGLINKLLEKRHYFDKISDIKNNEGSRDDLVKEYNKQFNYLMTKGFKNENIKKALKI